MRYISYIDRTAELVIGVGYRAAGKKINGARKIAPTTPPSNSRNFIDYPPPSKSARKIAPTTPPRIHGTSSTTPPLEIEPPFSEPWLRPCSERWFVKRIYLFIHLFIYSSTTVWISVTLKLIHKVKWMLLNKIRKFIFKMAPFEKRRFVLVVATVQFERMSSIGWTGSVDWVNS